MSGPLHESSSSSPTCWLGEALSEQPWHMIGNCAPPLAATSDLEEIINQLTSIMEVRLKDLVVHRQRRREQQKQKQKRKDSGKSYGGSVGGNIKGEDCDGGNTTDINSNSADADDDECFTSEETLLLLQDDGELHPFLRDELRDYVSAIASAYRAVKFHNLEHAVHVTVSAHKLLSMMIRRTECAKKDPRPGERDREGGGEGGGGGGGGDGYCGGTSRRTSGRFRRSTMQHVEMGESTVTDRVKKKRQGSIDSSCGGAVGVGVIPGCDGNPEGEAGDEGGDGAFDPTYGLSSDPLARFALVFSALIHDVDHRGVSNAQLVKEADDIAVLHNDSSVLEQNSLQVAFALLFRGGFALLKRSIMPTSADRSAFRELVIGIVLATDISSPDRMQITQSKWLEAFNPLVGDGGDGGADGEPSSDEAATTAEVAVHEVKEAGEAVARRRHSMYASEMSRKRLLKVRLGIRQSLHLDGKLIDIYAETKDGDFKLRASAVLELMMNVADVAHTMQGFGVFCKWNKHLYRELLLAYRAGRNSWDPATNWYQNQINFIDAYIVPLAERLEVCGVFGSQGTILLYFTMENKRRWMLGGSDITRKMILEVEFELATLDLDDDSDD